MSASVRRKDLRQGLNAMREAVQKRTIPPEELRGYTITLSNFGTFGGRYANPMIVPPTVAILGAGRIRPAWSPGTEPAVHTIIPLSLTFDHRADRRRGRALPDDRYQGSGDRRVEVRWERRPREGRGVVAGRTAICTAEAAGDNLFIAALM